MRIGKQVDRMASDQLEWVDRQTKQRMECEAPDEAAETRGKSAGTMKDRKSVV